MRSGVTLFAVLICTVFAGCSSSPQPATAAPLDSCSGLAGSDKVIFEQQPFWQSAAPLPRFCKVRGSIAGKIQFEYRLPEHWNGRFLMAGCGGFCGALLPDKKGHSNSINEALKRGYAAISHDGGHQASGFDTRWAYDDTQALEIWAHKVLPMVVAAGTELARQFYGRPPDYRYYSGCSNGGRLGLIAAQRYPQLFDGIAAGASIFDLSGIAGLWGNWMIRQAHEPVPVLAPAQVAELKSVIMAQCDGIDGLVDGIIQQPRQCDVDFAALECTAPDKGQQSCLSSLQVAALTRLYGGVEDGDGELIYPALQAGSEQYSDIWLFGTEAKPAWGVLASEGYRQLLSHDLFGVDAPEVIGSDAMVDWIERSSIPDLSDAVDTDLSGLKRAGGKLLIYQGWSDPLIIPEPIIRYYEQAASEAGGIERLQQQARLFMVPGWGHCWERPSEAPDQFDPLMALESWVERDRVPEYLVAEQRDESATVIRSRPICAYPKIARFMHSGDIREASSYQCVAATDETGGAGQ